MAIEHAPLQAELRAAPKLAYISLGVHGFAIVLLLLSQTQSLTKLFALMLLVVSLWYQWTLWQWLKRIHCLKVFSDRLELVDARGDVLFPRLRELFITRYLIVIRFRQHRWWSENALVIVPQSTANFRQLYIALSQLPQSVFKSAAQ